MGGFERRTTGARTSVAVKVLPEDLGAMPSGRQPLRREARIVAALNHPNIVTIHTVG